MGDCVDKIPIVDFSAYRLSLEKPDRSQFQKLVDDVHKALTTIGFFFIVNTDIQQEKVEELFQISKTFFDLPVELKQNSPTLATSSSGYVHLERENLNPDRLYGDLKESFNMNSVRASLDWPMESNCPGFKTAMTECFDLCVTAHDRILEVMGHGLKLEDPLFFVKYHAKPNMNTLRTLYYPSLNDVTVKEQQVRCGEHSDYGGITLLFQQKSGLEVRKPDGNYIKVPMVEGGILVNIGDLMQRWTADTYIATKHRVLLDETPDERGQNRQTIVFFGYPTNDAVIECIDKSNKYPPIGSLEYLNMRFSATY